MLPFPQQGLSETKKGITATMTRPFLGSRLAAPRTWSHDCPFFDAKQDSIKVADEKGFGYHEGGEVARCGRPARGRVLSEQQTMVVLDEDLAQGRYITI